MKLLTPALSFFVVLLCGASLADAQTARKQRPSLNGASSAASPEAAATIVVFNETDRDSVELAKFYAEKRGIPKEQVIGLKCSRNEEITREEYEVTIAEPLRRAFTANFWWKLRDAESPLGPVEANRIRFVALIRGVPLKIAEAPGYPGDNVTGPPPVGTTNQAAVDSELAVLGLRSRVISGAVNNPYFRRFTPIADANLPHILLVCRLDAPTPAIVRRMITDSLEAEENGLAGLTYVDARGIKDAGYAEGDEWLFSLANAARRSGSPVVLDNGAGLFPENYPMTHAALYFGWYTDHLSGPFVRSDFRFVPGAVAVHIHSFSANTLRDSLRHWSGPLVAAGAAATLGNVYEPYLTLTPHLDVFHDRLRSGLTFAESAYMAQRVLSWMTTFVGDPLYRPFKGVALLAEKPSSGEWSEYRQAARLWFSADRAKGEEALRAVAKKYRSGVSLEGLGLLLLSVNDRDAALIVFPQARQFYGRTEDAMRVAVHEIIQLKAAGREDDARALAKEMIALVPRSPSVVLLNELTIPPPAKR